MLEKLTVLQGAQLLLENNCVKKGDIVIKGNTIIAVCNDAQKELNSTWDKAEKIYCDGMLATPGLVNAHTHAGMVLFRSYADDMALMDWLETKIWPAEAKLTKESIYWGTQLAIAEMLRSGTTVFLDMYYHLPEAVRAALDVGMRIVASRGITALGEGKAGEEKDFNRCMREAEEYFKEYHNAGDGLVKIMFGPHAIYTIAKEYLYKVTEKAKELGVEINMHIAETKTETELCFKKYGKTPVKVIQETGLLDCGVVAAHCVHVDKEDIEILQKNKVRVVHNPSSNMKLASGIAPVSEMLEAGVCVALGTDGASSNNNLNLLEEAHLAAMLGKIDRMQATDLKANMVMKMATENGAKALGFDNVLGKIDVGYKADIVLWELNKPHWYPKHDLVSQLVYAGQAADVHTVIVNGQVLMENRQLKTIDEERLFFEIDRISRMIFN